MAATEDDPEKKGRVWALDQQLDQPPIDLEAKKIIKEPKNPNKCSSFMVLALAFQSLGVVYGDLGTSPLYVFYNTFPDGIEDKEDVVGALSVIIYSLTFIPLLKYVFIVCRANDNGQGGTFALYSLLCRHAKIKMVPNQDQTDEELTTFSRSTFSEKSFAARIKRGLEGHEYLRHILFILVLIGSCMVIGDGILTPAISVLSAVGGMNVYHKEIGNHVVVLAAVMILIFLFIIQQYGIGKVYWLFAPVVFLWFLLIGGIGIFNIMKYDRSILKAFSPVYMYRYFKRRGRGGWESLGGIMLSINGTETLFADLNHFPVLSVQIAFTVLVFPCLLLAYCGQAAYLVKNSDDVSRAFYHSVPEIIYWPVFAVAIAAAVVASQSTITATFSLIKQALALGCFPRVKVIHTSTKYRHQIYIPDVNWILMILCIAVTAGFSQQTMIGNAAGTAVVIVMLVTTHLMILVMIVVWRCHWILVLMFTGFSLLVEGPYLSAVLLKVDEGGWAPLLIATVFFIVMYVWHYGTVRRYDIEMHSKVSMAWILGLGPSLGLVRVPGVNLVYSELASGVPRIFSHFITNLPAIHSVVVFVCVKYLPVCTVPEEERFFVKRIGPNEFHMFRCFVRYGYKDDHKKDDDFEEKIFDSLFMFLRLESLMEASSDTDVSTILDQQEMEESEVPFDNNISIPFSNATLSISSVENVMRSRETTMNHSSHALTVASSSRRSSSSSNDEINEIEFLHNCKEAGVVHMMGNTVVRARRNSNFVKVIVIDYLYSFLRKICRGNSVLFFVPQESLLNVGQILYV